MDRKNRKLYITCVIMCVTLISPAEKNKIEKCDRGGDVHVKL